MSENFGKNNFGDFGFEEITNFNSENILDQESQLILKNEKRRKTVNTYITGFKMSKDELKSHHQALKKKFGCGGSLKIDKKKNILVFHLSYGGDEENEEIIEYLVEKLSIDRNNIKVEG